MELIYYYALMIQFKLYLNTHVTRLQLLELHQQQRLPQTKC